MLRRNVLIFHQGALGDFVVTWPLALGLARVLAQSRIFYVTSGQKGALAERALRVESADVEGGWHQLFSEKPALPERPSKLLNGAQWIISFVSGPQDRWAQNVRAMAPEAHLVTLSTTPPDDFAGHITDFMLGQLKDRPIVEAAMAQMLKSVAARGIGAASGTSGSVVIHPGAGSGKKCWPAERFLELARKLKQSGKQVEVLIGEVEQEKWPADLLKEFSSTAEVRTPSTLVELMNHLLGACAFVGNDSGPGHLAGILGVPTVSIFGPRDPVRWKPLGPKVQIVSAEWDQISTDRVLSTLS